MAAKKEVWIKDVLVCVITCCFYLQILRILRMIPEALMAVLHDPQLQVASGQACVKHGQIQFSSIFKDEACGDGNRLFLRMKKYSNILCFQKEEGNHFFVLKKLQYLDMKYVHCKEQIAIMGITSYINCELHAITLPFGYI